MRNMKQQKWMKKELTETRLSFGIRGSLFAWLEMFVNEPGWNVSAMNRGGGLRPDMVDRMRWIGICRSRCWNYGIRFIWKILHTLRKFMLEFLVGESLHSHIVTVPSSNYHHMNEARPAHNKSRQGPAFLLSIFFSLASERLVYHETSRCVFRRASPAVKVIGGFLLSVTGWRRSDPGCPPQLQRW
jgi:hypothetical protein